MKAEYSFNGTECRFKYKGKSFDDKSKIETTVFCERFRLENFAASVLSEYRNNDEFRKEVDSSLDDGLFLGEMAEFALALRLQNAAGLFLVEYLEPFELGLPEEDLEDDEET